MTKKIAAKYDDPYINITAPFTGADGRLPANETIDGLHLNDYGYDIWRDQIRQYVYS